MTLEQALKAKLIALSAVAAITTTVRPYTLSQGDVKRLNSTDPVPAVLVSVDVAEPLNFLSGRADLVKATVTLTAVSPDASEAVDLAEAIRSNGTDPGTGMAGFKGTAGTLDIDSIWEKKETDYTPHEDGSDTGYMYVDSTFTIWYYQTL